MQYDSFPDQNTVSMARVLTSVCWRRHRGWWLVAHLDTIRPTKFPQGRIFSYLPHLPCGCGQTKGHTSHNNELWIKWAAYSLCMQFSIIVNLIITDSVREGSVTGLLKALITAIDGYQHLSFFLHWSTSRPAHYQNWLILPLVTLVETSSLTFERVAPPHSSSPLPLSMHCACASTRNITRVATDDWKMAVNQQEAEKTEKKLRPLYGERQCLQARQKLMGLYTTWCPLFSCWLGVNVVF